LREQTQSIQFEESS